MSGGDIAARVAKLDWPDIAVGLDGDGYAVVEGLLTPTECGDLGALYGADDGFRSRVVMAHHNFGQGEYKYFDHPLPALVTELRAALYAPLAGIANRWNETLGAAERFPGDHGEYIARGHDAGQTRPTPLLLEYRTGDYNCLHQDIYGEQVFPLQAAFLLSDPGAEFTGGEFVLTQQRPRMQSIAAVVPLALGDGVIFPVRMRPVQGKRGPYRVTMRHGVSRIRAGLRRTLGVIFHDAA